MESLTFFLITSNRKVSLGIVKISSEFITELNITGDILFFF